MAANSSKLDSTAVCGFSQRMKTSSCYSENSDGYHFVFVRVLFAKININSVNKYL